MISVVTMENIKYRALGWVQDPNNLRSLCRVVGLFDGESPIHQEVCQSIGLLVKEQDGRAKLLAAMAVRPLKLGHQQLIGTSFKPRSASRCNGIVQAAVKGQSRPFIGDWPANNFVRWAHAFGFLYYDYADDTFALTEAGQQLASAYTSDGELNEQEQNLVINAALSYPPACRILQLLAKECAHLTKFELGSQLGFVGEGGFTSQPQGLLIQELAQNISAHERNTMRTNWEGSSDKYARTIAGWLCKLGLAQQSPKTVTVTIGGVTYSESIGQSYLITAQGLRALRRAQGVSKHRRIRKNVYYELFSPSGHDREYLRTRRAYLLQRLQKGKWVTIEALLSHLAEQGLEETAATISDDLAGFVQIGIDVECKENNYRLRDELSDFVIPIMKRLAPSDHETIKAQLREQLRYLPHHYLALVDLAYDGAQNRLFEMQTLDLLVESCHFQGLHLGGSRRPDGVIYTDQLSENYGVIIDTKAYSGGYSLPISQADEMERYIRENQQRSLEISDNSWWAYFPADLSRYYFTFISGHFKGRYQEQLQRLCRSAGVYGAAIAIDELLLFADQVAGESADTGDFERQFLQNLSLQEHHDSEADSH